MIRAKIQAVLQQICNSYSPSVNSDEMPGGVFCVHESKVANTLRDKEGIYGFEFDLVVMVFGQTDSSVDSTVESITETLEMLTDSRIDSTTYESTSGLQYDNDIQRFYNQLNFKVVTNNL